VEEGAFFTVQGRLGLGGVRVFSENVLQETQLF
jgi:hypothetical protein